MIIIPYNTSALSNPLSYIPWTRNLPSLTPSPLRTPSSTRITRLANALTRQQLLRGLTLPIAQFPTLLPLQFPRGKAITGARGRGLSVVAAAGRRRRGSGVLALGLLLLLRSRGWSVVR